MTAQFNSNPSSDINLDDYIPTAQQVNVEEEVNTTEETVNLTNRVLEPDSTYAPPLAVITFDDADNEFKNLKNHQQLNNCSTNIKEFLSSVESTFGIDLTTKDITSLNDVVETIEGSWTFFKLLIKHQVQIVCLGFRKSTTESTQGKRGPTGTTLPQYLGNVRASNNRGGQQGNVTAAYESLQAVNTLMGVIGRQVPIDARGNVGTYNNSCVIPSGDYELVNSYVASLDNWNLSNLEDSDEGIKVKQILERIHSDVNTFLNNRNSGIFKGNTASYTVSKGNAKWLADPQHNEFNVGSYYMICSNNYTTASLSTVNTMNARQNITGVAGKTSNALVLTAESPIFRDFWKTDVDTKGNTVINPEELFKKCFSGDYNRSVTLPPGGFLLGFTGTTTFVNQNMVDLLSSELHQPNLDNTSTPVNVIQDKTITGNTLLGALTLGLMRLGGYPVEDYVSSTFLNEVINQYKLTGIISTFSDVEEGTLPTSVIEASAKVERSEVPLRAAWLANLIMGVIGSNKQGADKAIARATQTTESALGDVNESNAFEFPPSVEAAETPTTSSSVSS